VFLVESVVNFVKMFEQSIGLSEPWSVERAEFSEDSKEVHVYIKARKTAQYACPECGEICSRYDDEEKERIWRHGDVVFFPCYIHCRRPRIKCEKHGTRVVEAPWARAYSRYTMLFESYAMFLVKNMPVEAARKLLRISHTSLTNIMWYWVDKAVSEDDLSEAKHLSIDETSFKRGHSYVTVISDMTARRVIGVEPDRSMESVELFSYKLESKGGKCENIQTVSCDMSKAYMAAKELCFPNAETVIDRFHVKQLILKGMDEVRREEQGKTSKSRKSGRKLLMIPEGRMTEKQQEVAEILCKQYPKTGRAFRMVQCLDDVYRCQTRAEADDKFNKLLGWLSRSRLEPMKKVGRTFKTYKNQILNYFTDRITNAIAEAINSLIQAAKRKARGYVTFRGYACMIYLVVGKLKLACPMLFSQA